MKYIFTIVLWFAWSITSTIDAQYLTVSPELATQLEGKRKFSEIMNTIDAYYVSRDYHNNPTLFSQYKKWNRWAWYAVRHLDDQGEIDYKSGEYFEEAQKMEPYRNAEGSRTNSGGWQFTGPYNVNWANNVGSKGIGRVDRLAFHPTNSNIIFAATPAGGLWRTNDAGLNWFSVSSNIPNCGISGIVISADDPSGNKIYILTGDGDSGPNSFVASYGYLRRSIGVLVTYDGGYTWSTAGNSKTVLENRQCYKLLQIRNTPARLLAATDNGIYISNDWGNTWAQSEFAGNTVFDFEQHPTDDAIVYAAFSSVVRKSTNNGLTFAITPTFSPAANVSTRSNLAVVAANSNEVYFLQCGSSNRLYKSTDSGNTFNSINTSDLITGQYSYNCSFAINPANNNLMVAGGLNALSSSNNGSSFGNTTVGIVQNVPIPANYLHSDIHDLAYNPVSNVLFAGCDGGVFISTDNGVNWTERSNGLCATQYYHMDGFEGTNNLIIGGAQDNGTGFTTNGGTMNYCGTADGFSVDFVSGDNNIFYMVENTNVMRFTRSTSNRTNVSPGTAANQTFYPNIITHPTNNSIVYVGYANSIWRSNNQGNAGSWTQISSTGTSNGGAGHTGGFAVSANAPDRLYAANATTIRRSEDQGNNWTTISGNPGWPAAFGVITDITCRSNNANEIWISTTGTSGGNKVFYSGDAGANWINFTGTLPNMPVYSIVYTSEGDAYIGTELGVYFMDFNMSDWVPFYNGLPLVPVTDLFVNEAFGIILASTFGRGIWQGDLYSDCGPFLFLTGNTQGQQFYQSNGFIETSQVVPGSIGNVLRLRSPQKIIFKNGFRSYNNSQVHAIIGNCGQGIFNYTGSTERAVAKGDYLKTASMKLSGD